jgi:hypothetical protein
MDPNATSDEATPPVLPTQPPHASGAMASSFSLGRMVLIGLGVLGLGLTIAFGGYYYGLKNSPRQATLYPTPSTTTASPTAAIKNTTTYTNTVYGYSLEYPKDLQVQGQGIQVTDTTAPEVLFAPKINIATPDPLRAFHITVTDKKLLGTVKPLADQAAADFSANENNKNTYVNTVDPLASGVVAGKQAFTFTMQSKGFSGAGMGFLWDLGSYTTTEFDTDQYRFLLFYSNTNEMIQVVSSIQLTK